MLMTQYDTVTVLTAQVDEKIDEIMPCTSPVSAASTRNPLWNGMRRLSSRGLHNISRKPYNKSRLAPDTLCARPLSSDGWRATAATARHEVV
jgi:hypothetical protein